MEISEIKQYVEERLLTRLGLTGRRYNLSEIGDEAHVNFVYRVEIDTVAGKPTIVYLKHAEGFVKRKPDTKLPVERQIYEARAVELFSGFVGDRVPSVIDLDNGRHILALTSIEHGGSLTSLLAGNIFYPLAWRDLGRSVGIIHKETYSREIWIKPEAANRAHNEFIVPFRYTGALGLASGPSKRHIEEAKQEETCVVWGDPLRKNIFQTEDKSYFIDFENSVRYEPGYDIGYALAELAVKSLDAEGNLEKVKQCAAEFILGYSSVFEPAGKIAHILHRSVKHLAAIMLHRTTGESGTNRLDFREDVRLRLVATAVKILNSDYKNPLDVFDIISGRESQKVENTSD